MRNLVKYLLRAINGPDTRKPQTRVHTQSTWEVRVQLLYVKVDHTRRTGFVVVFGFCILTMYPHSMYLSAMYSV